MRAFVAAVLVTAAIVGCKSPTPIQLCAKGDTARCESICATVGADQRATACINAADAHRTSDPVGAMHFDELACGAGASDVCVTLGKKYRSGTGVPRDLAKAATFFTKACDQSYTPGCDELHGGK